MSHSYTSSLHHCIFSTKGRFKTISPEIQESLWPYMGGIARQNKMKALAIGGAADHAHLLLSIPPTLTLAKAIQLIKGNSSKWVHETFPNSHAFAWQEGYGAFSIGISQIDSTVSYIQGQLEHHRIKTFEEEFLSILRKHGMEIDLRYVWG